MEFIREDCIYARQSVDRKDSISIESQIDFCKYELKGGSCRVFKDKGYSGKNTDRPEFQKLLGEIRKGKVRRVIVYKLDRISRSILDFATMMELFQEYDVEFVSSTEKFDTSTPMGRAMLNICIVFAQLERETIQKRVTDAYYSRCLKGFHMSGQAPYGYQLEPKPIQHFDDFEQLAPVCGGVHGNENIGKAVDSFHIAACRHPDHFCERLRDCSGDKVDFVLADFAGRGYNTLV